MTSVNGANLIEGKDSTAWFRFDLHEKEKNKTSASRLIEVDDWLPPPEYHNAEGFANEIVNAVAVDVIDYHVHLGLPSRGNSLCVDRFFPFFSLRRLFLSLPIPCAMIVVGVGKARPGGRKKENKEIE